MQTVGGQETEPLLVIIVGWVCRQIWRQITYKQNQRISAVLLLYTLNVFLFAGVYYYLFKETVDDTPQHHFAFSSDIVRNRNDNVRADLKEQLVDRQHLVHLFEDFETKLKGTSTVTPRELSGHPRDFIDFEEAPYSCEIDVGMLYSDIHTGKVVREMTVLAEKEELRRLYGKDMRFEGPFSGEPPSKQALDWVSKVGSSSQPALYVQALDQAIGELSNQTRSLEASLALIDPNLNPQPAKHWGYFDFVYFSTMTQATVGYGDIVPNSSATRSLVCLQVVMGLALAGFGFSFIIRPRGE